MSIVQKKQSKTIENPWNYNVSTFVMCRGVTCDITRLWPSQGLVTPITVPFKTVWPSRVTGWVDVAKIEHVSQVTPQVAELKNQNFSSPSRCPDFGSQCWLCSVRCGWPGQILSSADLCHTTTGWLPKFVHRVPCHTPSWTVLNATVFCPFVCTNKDSG